jgi:hypothetical protein
MKLTPRPVCSDCGYVASTIKDHDEVWTITKEGYWLCDDCYQSSWDNDKPEMNELCDCADSNCTICGS